MTSISAFTQTMLNAPLSSRLIALDCDGVLLNYNLAYPPVWKKAFGQDLPLLKANQYHAHSAYGVDLNDPRIKERFFASFDEAAWSTMPALPGSLEACLQLAAMGFELVCVSSMPPEFSKARARNLRNLGFPIEYVVATGRNKSHANPKLAELTRLQPVAFVDDLAHNFLELPPGIHKALIEPGHEDSPNLGVCGLHDSEHATLKDFVDYWAANQDKALRTACLG